MRKLGGVKVDRTSIGLIVAPLVANFVGTEGDVLTNDGIATIPFGGTAEEKVPFGRGIYSIDFVF